MCSCRENFSKMRVWLLSDSTRLIRYTVLFVCCLIVIYQLSECLFKLIHPPITTHSRYELSSMMTLPAVTFCREPPYKFEVLAKYNIRDHPHMDSEWINFPYENASMTDMFEQATYNQSETFIQSALAGNANMIDIESSLHFNLGKCHTLRPKAPMKSSFKNHGYSLMLKHDSHKNSSEANATPGWHIYFHEAKENFTEIRMKASGRIDYVFAEVEEDIEIKLQTQHFTMMTDSDRTCSNDVQYSAPKCGEICLWTEITDKVNCTTPWMPDIKLPICNNSKSMRNLVKEYNRIYDDEVEPGCTCDDPCRSVIYSTYVVSRKELIQNYPMTQVWIYYTSKLVTIIEERPGYDLPQFVADMGGSLGFLLGLSVLGLIGILEKIATLIFGKYFHNKDKEIKMDDDKSDTTAEISARERTCKSDK